MDVLDAAVKILGIGLSGFGFLLMYFAFQLIKTMITNNGPVNPSNNSLVKTFLWVTIVMTVIVGSFTFFSAYYKNDKIETQASSIKSKSDTLKLLNAVQRSATLSDSLLKFAGADNKKAALSKNEQKKLLDTISIYAKSLNDKNLAKQVAVYKKALVTLPDSTLKTRLTTTKKDSLKTVYDNASKSLFKAVFSKQPLPSNK